MGKDLPGKEGTEKGILILKSEIMKVILYLRKQ